jgi:hypothetical protein
MTRLSIITAFAAISMLLGCETREPQVSVEIGTIIIRPHRVKVTAYCLDPVNTDSTPCEATKAVGNLCERFARGESLCATGDRDIPMGTIAIVIDPTSNKEIRRCTVIDRKAPRYAGSGSLDLVWGTNAPGYEDPTCVPRAKKIWGTKQLKVRYEDPIQLDGEIKIAQAD